MNKIINANINGFVFNIDEMAYEKLKNYLETIRQKVKSEEVMTDIENRIAELFDYKLKNGAQAIFDKDIEDIMSQIGSPEQFGQDDADGETGSENTSSTATNTSSGNRKRYRRLYRNEDDKIIGGVCSGIAAYFGIDPLFLRIGFAISLFAFGTGILLYLFLMLVLPKALTPSEKLEMMGEPVDFNNLSKTIEKDFKEAYDRYKPEVKTGFERFLEVLVKVGAIVLIIFLVSIFIPVGFGIFTSIGVASWFIPVLSSYVFLTHTEGLLILIGLLLFLLIPLIGAAYKLIRIVFKTKPMNKAVSIGMSILWFIGFCLLAFSTYNIGTQFSSSSKISTSDTMQIADRSKEILIRATDTDPHSRFIIKSDDGDEHYSIHTREDMKEFIDDKIGRNIEMKIVRGFSDKPVINIIRKSNGGNGLDAGKFAAGIQYNYVITDSSILLDDFFTIKSQQLWRNQRIKILIEMPKDLKFYIDKSCSGLMDEHHFRDYEEDYDGSIYNKTLKVDEKGNIVN